MRYAKTALAALLICLCIPCLCAAQGIEIGALAPLEMAAEENAQTLALYCGPTQGFYRHGDQALDTGKPFVVFGQHDCWAMAAQGTADAFGPVGWVEAGSIDDIPYDPQLTFDDGLQVTVEDAAILTNDPMNADADVIVRVVPGTVVMLLAAYDGWAYIQAEFADMPPVRAFIPMSAIE
ncbi:MAG: hypothetical protein IJD60_00350 [Clostridia bacterium]|nr:hypothetical protein [Clostridia bacterium]